MTTYWCELAWLGDLDGHVERGVTITVEGDRISGVGPGAEIDHEGPGLRVLDRGLRGRTHGETGSFWTWRERMYALADRVDPDSYRALATATFAEMVLEDAAVVVSPGSMYGPSGEGFFRISLTTPDDRISEAGMEDRKREGYF